MKKSIEETTPSIFGYKTVPSPYNPYVKIVLSDDLPFFMKESKVAYDLQYFIIYNIELEKYFVYNGLQLPGDMKWIWNDNPISCMTEDDMSYTIGSTEIIRNDWENKKNILAVPCFPYWKTIKDSIPFHFVYIDYGFDGTFYPLEVFDKELRGGGPR